MKSEDTKQSVFNSVPAPFTAQERGEQPAWDWMDEVLDASFPASDPPSFSPTRIGKPPRG